MTAKKQKSTASFLKAFLESDARMQGIKQAFVISALDIYIRECQANPKENNPMPGMVTDELWQSVADELGEAMAVQYGKH